MDKPPYICPRCNELTRTTIQRTDSTTRYCSPCYHELNEADAKLGRLVHKALDSSAGVFSQKLSMGPHNNNRPGYWVSIITSSGERETYHGDTLLDALLAAGIADD